MVPDPEEHRARVGVLAFHVEVVVGDRVQQIRRVGRLLNRLEAPWAHDAALDVITPTEHGAKARPRFCESSDHPHIPFKGLWEVQGSIVRPFDHLQAEGEDPRVGKCVHRYGILPLDGLHECNRLVPALGRAVALVLAPSGKGENSDLHCAPPPMKPFVLSLLAEVVGAPQLDCTRILEVLVHLKALLRDESMFNLQGLLLRAA
mmetsp:Transcript_136689/g.424638  ORF Transcript_136689/g.424638 Transcript_136689/m.424638 type:complete len:204 (-) Transcript_136689:707-1318(-)